MKHVTHPPLERGGLRKLSSTIIQYIVFLHEHTENDRPTTMAGWDVVLIPSERKRRTISCMW